jgi:hypothetical protein
MKFQSFSPEDILVMYMNVLHLLITLVHCDATVLANQTVIICDATVLANHTVII